MRKMMKVMAANLQEVEVDISDEAISRILRDNGKNFKLQHGDPIKFVGESSFNGKRGTVVGVGIAVEGLPSPQTVLWFDLDSSGGRVYYSPSVSIVPV